MRIKGTKVMHLFQLYQLATLAAACRAAAVQETSLHCKELLIPVDVSAKNFPLPSDLTAANLTSDLLGSLGFHPNKTVAGCFNIGARYCEPVKPMAHRHNTLQILVHGITYTRDYWSGLAAPGTKPGQDRYSWILYAAKQGYPTLSIDRLCNGLSSHPDGINACQIPLQTETVHALIAMARAGKLLGPDKTQVFDKIVLAGRSYGSLVANYLSITHPNDADVLLMTGFSYNITNSLGASANLGIEPAAKAVPSRFGNLESSYLAFTNHTGDRQSFYFGRFKQSVVDYDFSHRGTVSIGEFASVLLGQQAAPSYRGKLFVMNGAEDADFCEESPATAAAGKPGNCLAGFDQVVQSFYPSSSGFAFFDTPETGHCLNLHLTAQRSYKAAHDFLAQSGF